MPTTTTYTTPTRTAPSTGGCGCGCGSPACDSLQCLCRPRFFAGQLVTDADFRRLDQYMVGKSRLHNKFLHGVGVVCGLEVVCNPCDDTVIVRPGYALGPCGEDIVVCSDTRVDVGAMIRAQRKAVARACPPGSNPYLATPDDCDALEQAWILGICYDEQPGQPVTTLTASSCSSCSGGCGGGCGGSCGGSKGTTTSSGGCGCGGSTTSSYSSTPSSSGCGCGSGSSMPLPTGCEPTVICEGFRFALTKVKPQLRGAVTSQGALAAAAHQCLALLRANITSIPQNPTAAEVVTYAWQLKADLRAVIDSGNIHDCTLGQRLGAIVLPAPTDRGAAAKARAAITEMLAIAVDLYRECICSALLPPCPDGGPDDCVPIATLTVRNSDLRVLDVCNWSSRKFAVTMPTLGYWFGWLPFASAARKLVSALCCPPQKEASFGLNAKLNVTTARPTVQARMSTTSSAYANTPADLFTEPFRLAAQMAANPSALAGLEATLLQGLGATGTGDAALATDDELDSPFAALALSRLFGPTGLDLGTPVTDAVERISVAPDQGDRLAALEKSLETLQRTVRSQASTIAALRKKGDQQ